MTGKCRYFPAGYCILEKIFFAVDLQAIRDRPKSISRCTSDARGILTLLVGTTI